MDRTSISSRSLLLLGVILVIVAGFSTPTIPPIGYWGLYGNYILLIGGSMLIVLAAVIMLRKRK